MIKHLFQTNLDPCLTKKEIKKAESVRNGATTATHC